MRRDMELVIPFQTGLSRKCQFVREDLEIRKLARSKRSDNGNIGGVAPTGHQNAPDTRRIVPSIEGVPAPKIHLKPGTKIHWIGFRRHTNVSEVTSAVARRHIHAAAERNRDVREVSADAPTFGMRLPRRLGRARVLVSEREVVVDVISNCLDQWPSLSHISKLGPSQFDKEIRLAISTAEQINQCFNWQLF